jgi:proteasome lid subunit RPN8/RPN11
MLWNPVLGGVLIMPWKGDDMDVEVQPEQVVAHPRLLADIRMHAHIEADRGAECVGFLACKLGSSKIVARMPLHNHSPDVETGYYVEPWEQYRAEHTLAEGGYEVAGSYHSHPHSEAIPSQADAALARPGELIFIYSVAYDELTGWREVNGRLEKVEIIES